MIPTPTQLLYHAAMRTPEVAAPKGTIHYRPPAVEDVPDEPCWLCGAPTHRRGLPLAKALSDTFTDHGRAKAPESRSVCEPCCFARAPARPSPLRMYSILATPEGLRHPIRSDWREILLNPPEPPVLACIAVSGQKWLHYKGHVALSRNPLIVLLEEMPVWVEADRYRSVLADVEELLRVFRRQEIETGRYPEQRVREFGLVRWQEIESRLEAERGTPLFQLVAYVAQRPEGGDEPRSTDSTRTASTPRQERSSSTPSGGAGTRGSSRSRPTSGARSSGPSSPRPSGRQTSLPLSSG